MAQFWKVVEQQASRTLGRLPKLPVRLRRWMLKGLPFAVGFFALFQLLSVVQSASFLTGATIAGQTIVLRGDQALAIILGLLVSLVHALCLLAAFHPLRKRQLLGWRLLFWGWMPYIPYAIAALFVSSLGASITIACVVLVAMMIYITEQFHEFFLKPTAKK